jgi:hypothetical protein
MAIKKTTKKEEYYFEIPIRKNLHKKIDPVGSFWIKQKKKNKNDFL